MKKLKRRSNNKKVFFLSTFCVVALFMAVGYSILSQTLELQGTANLYASEKYLWYQITNNYLATSGSGFYENPYEQKKYTYMGNGSSNFITLNNGELWRIISIEKDHTLKVIKWDDSLTIEFDTLNNRTNSSSYCTNLQYGCNSWTNKEVFTNGTLTGNIENDSSLLTYLNTTLYNGFSDEFKNQIIEHNFNIGPVEKSSTLEEALSKESEYIWNGKVGLLTITDALMPSNTTNMTIGDTTYDNNYFLESMSGKFVWTMNPVLNSSSEVWTIAYDKSQVGKNANSLTETIDNNEYRYVAIPVVHLKSTVEYNSGNGNMDNPFTIK